MKKNIAFLLILLAVISCSKPDDVGNGISHSISEIYPSSVRIGDTLTMVGENMHNILQFKLQSGEESFFLKPIKSTSDTAQVVVPTVYSEQLAIIFHNTPHPLKLVGTFPLRVNFLHDNVDGVKVIDENIAFVSAKSRLYKTVDGGYTWSMLRDFEKYIGTALFFINENEGWVEIHDGISQSAIYYTNDGGLTFEKISEQPLFYQDVSFLHFNSTLNGYFATTKGDFYETKNNDEFDLMYAFGSDDYYFSDVSINDNSILAIGNDNDDQSVFIYQGNNDYSVSYIDGITLKTQLINSSQAYLTMKTEGYEDQLLFNENMNSPNWTTTSDMRIHNFHFIDDKVGIGISSTGGYDNHDTFETYDGGKTWVHKFSFMDFQYATNIDFHEKVGFITGMRGRLWKHVFE